MKLPYPIFGLDLDNTVIDYSLSAKKFALSNEIEGVESVIQLREFFRESSEHYAWSQAQEWIYTEGLLFAQVKVGVVELISQLKSFNIPLYIISHKTKVSINGIDLWGPANSWLVKHLGNFFDSLPENVFFEETRKKKLIRISDLNISHFVDDLQEVLLEPEFPSNVRKFWISEEDREVQHASITKINSLKELLSYV